VPALLRGRGLCHLGLSTWSFLDQHLFEPLDMAEPLCWLQKTLFLLMLAMGYHIREVSSLSGQFWHQGDHLFMQCVPGFLPKHHTSQFMSSPSTIWRFHRDNPLPINHCPVRVFPTYIHRSATWLAIHSSNGHVFLWHLLRSLRSLSQTLVTK